LQTVPGGGLNSRHVLIGEAAQAASRGLDCFQWTCCSMRW
jgi:hypothetical protein